MWCEGLAGFEPAFSCLKWGMCLGYPDSTWENGPDGVPLHYVLDRCASFISFFIIITFVITMNNDNNVNDNTNSMAAYFIPTANLTNTIYLPTQMSVSSINFPIK